MAKLQASIRLRARLRRDKRSKLQRRTKVAKSHNFRELLHGRSAEWNGHNAKVQVGIAAHFPKVAAGFFFKTGQNSERDETWDWKVPWTRRLESLRYAGRSKFVFPVRVLASLKHESGGGTKRPLRPLRPLRLLRVRRVCDVNAEGLV